MALTKADIITSIYSQWSISKAKSIQAVEALLEIMIPTLQSGEIVLIRDFGEFDVKEKGQRKGRNPQIGNDLILDPGMVITFRCSGVLREKLNGRILRLSFSLT